MDDPPPLQGDTETTTTSPSKQDKPAGEGNTTTTNNVEPPKKMISLKHIKEHDNIPALSSPAPAAPNKRVFLPETDSKQDFPLRVSEQLAIERMEEIVNNFEWQLEKLNSPERMRDSGWCDAELVDKLWIQKSRMDSLFDEGEGFIYRQVRDLICPLDSKGSKVYWNRAGDKLQEVYDCIPFFGDLKSPVEFFDVCGGPGAWSQFLLERLPRGSYGYGITLRLKDTPKSDVWYTELLDDRRFTPLYGEDMTGDVYNPDNVDYVVERVKKATMVVADGGFKIEKDADTGVHLENYQELYSSRIILAETLIAFRTLKRGGSFVCKLFDSFSHSTVSLLFLVCSLFEDVHIVKPPHSRRVNSERYLVANKFLGGREENKEEKKEETEEKEKEGKEEKENENNKNEENNNNNNNSDKDNNDNKKYKLAIEILEKAHKSGFTESTSLLSLFPIDWLKNDKDFVESISSMCSELCTRQTEALEVVMDEVDTKRSGRNKRKSYDDHDEYGRGSRGDRYRNNNRNRDDRDRRRDDRDRDNRDNSNRRDSRDNRDNRDNRNRGRDDRDRDRDRDRRDRDRDYKRDRKDNDKDEFGRDIL